MTTRPDPAGADRNVDDLLDEEILDDSDFDTSGFDSGDLTDPGELETPEDERLVGSMEDVAYLAESDEEAGALGATSLIEAVNADGATYGSDDDDDDDDDDEADEENEGGSAVARQAGTSAAEDGDEEDGDEEDGDDTGAAAVAPRRPDEFLCSSCFLIRPLRTEVEPGLCNDCA